MPLASQSVPGSARGWRPRVANPSDQDGNIRSIMRSLGEYQQVVDLLTEGVPDREIARRTGVPRSTIGYWRCLPANRPDARQPPLDHWRPSDPAAYCYVLGAYLGDGHVVLQSNSGILRVTLVALYEDVVDECAASLEAVFPEARVSRYRRRGVRVVTLELRTRSVPVAFPQHGPGKKHLRAIELVDWQRTLTAKHPRALIRGLIHSDGCRTVNRFTTRLPSGRKREYSYVRYFFSNLSSGIREIFCSHCGLIGVRCSNVHPRYVSIHDRRSVALLDEFVGPKVVGTRRRTQAPPALLRWHIEQLGRERLAPQRLLLLDQQARPGSRATGRGPPPASPTTPPRPHRHRRTDRSSRHPCPAIPLRP